MKALTSSIPTEFGQLSVLTSFAFVNRLTGTISGEISDMSASVAQQPQYNGLKGIVPIGLRLFVNFEFFDLEVNDISGAVPAEACAFPSLTTLTLHKGEVDAR